MKFSFSSVNWKQLPNKREKIMFVAALIVFTFGFFKSCWNPSSKAISFAKEDMKVAIQEKKQIKKALKEQSKIQKPVKRNVVTSAKMELYEGWAKTVAVLPNSILMRDFSSPAILRGVKLQQVDLQETKQKGAITELAWEITTSGSFISVGGYLERLETLPMLLIVEEIDIKNNTVIMGHIDAMIKGTAYGWK